MTNNGEILPHSASPIISLCNADPKAPFSDELAAVWRKGQFTEAAIAFLTKAGAEFFAAKCLKHQDCSQCRLCFTVQWPTNLDAVARLSPLMGPNLRIHLGSETPVESGTDVTPMLHSKAIYTDHGHGTCTGFVGSHNWTANALNGVNFEASVRVDCNSSDAFAVDLRKHLDECARRCIEFDPNDLAYYKAVQRALSSSRPPKPVSEQVFDFEPLPGSPVVVMHAEGDEKQLVTDNLMLFLPVKDRTRARWFNTTTPTSVLLFLYPHGSLFGRTSPASDPVLFHGPVGTNNDVTVSPSRETDVTCEIRELTRPVLQNVPDRNIPKVSNERYQIVADLRRIGPAEVPVYHFGTQPVLEVGVRFDDEQGDLNQAEGKVLFSQQVIGNYGIESMRSGILVFKEPIAERVIHLNIPERWIYPEDVHLLVQRRLSRNAPQDPIRIVLKVRKRKTKSYVYRASFQLR